MKKILASILLFLAMPITAQEWADCSWGRTSICFALDWQTATPIAVPEINVRARDKADFTPLYWAARYSPNPALILALIAAGAQVNETKQYQTIPLHWAARANANPDITATLINAGANVNAKNIYGRTPLHWAAWWSDNPTIIALLIDAGAMIEAKDNPGRTPLHYAKTPAVITALLSAKANINTPDNAGNTPLHHAVSNYQPAAILSLLANGAVATITNAQGKTPLALAKENTTFQNSAAYRALYDATFAP